MATMEMNGQTLFPMPDAAAALGLSIASLYKYVQRGLLNPVKLGSYNLIPESEIERYRQQHLAKVGRKPKKTA